MPTVLAVLSVCGSSNDTAQPAVVPHSGLRSDTVSNAETVLHFTASRAVPLGIKRLPQLKHWCEQQVLRAWMELFSFLLFLLAPLQAACWAELKGAVFSLHWHYHCSTLGISSCTSKLSRRCRICSHVRRAAHHACWAIGGPGHG